MNLRAFTFSLILGLLSSIITFFILLRPARLKGIIEKGTKRTRKNFIYNLVEKYTSPADREEYDDIFEKLQDFGFFGYRVGNFSDFITLKMILVSISLIFSIIIRLPFPKIIVMILLTVVAWKLPDIKLSREIQIMEKNVKNELPYVAEIIALGIEGGMDFNESVHFLTDNTKGNITDLLKEGYFNFTAGGGEEKSYINAAKKSLCEEFVNLIKTVFQNKKLGMLVSEAIFRQAENIRYKNATDLKLKVERIPVIATLIIMGFFFFPILIIMIAPVFAEVFKLFTG